MIAKYEPQIRAMFTNIFKDDYIMHDVDHDRAINMIMEQTGETMQSLSDKIEVGVENGFSAEWQIDVMQKEFKKAFK